MPEFAALLRASSAVIASGSTMTGCVIRAFMISSIAPCHIVPAGTCHRSDPAEREDVTRAGRRVLGAAIRAAAFAA